MTEKLTEISSDRMILVRSDGRVIEPVSTWRYVRPDDYDKIVAVKELKSKWDVNYAE